MVPARAPQRRAADDDLARVGTDAHLEVGKTKRRAQLSDGVDDGDAGGNREARIVLVSPGVSEVREHSVAQVLGDETEWLGIASLHALW